MRLRVRRCWLQHKEPAMNCRTCHYSFQDPALVLRCRYFNRICYQPCDWYKYEPGTLA